MSSSPSKALHPVSPERINQQIMPASPSLPADLAHLNGKRSRGGSDVQAKVAFLNSLARGQNAGAVPQQSSSTSASSSAALQRAILGREEAETALANASAQLRDAQSRERRLSERLESLLEELQNVKQRQSHERSVFEKEIRKARKEAFKAGSMLVKLQEELKDSRSEIRSLKDELKVEKDAKQKANQEAFERAYALAGLTEELEVLKDRLRSSETNNQAKTLQARADEMQERDLDLSSGSERHFVRWTPHQRRRKRAADEPRGRSGFELHHRSGSGSTPPKRPRLSDEGSPSENESESTSSMAFSETMDDLRDELDRERKLRVDAEDMIHYLKMECQFMTCSCRIAESLGTRYVHDHEWDAKMRAKEALEKADEENREPSAAANEEEPQVDARPQTPVQSHTPPPKKESTPPSDAEKAEEILEEPILTFSPRTGTFRTVPSPLRVAQAPGGQNIAQLLPTDATVTEENGGNAALDCTTPKTENDVFEFGRNPVSFKRRGSPVKQETEDKQEEGSIPEHSTTTTIPLRSDGDPAPSSFPNVPGTPISREQALAQIRARRGKTQNMKRSASAGEALTRPGGMGVTPVRNARRIPAVQTLSLKATSEMKARRDMSAPCKLPR